MQVSVYILRCADGSYYVGLTRKNPEGREWEHNQKLIAGYTSTRTPVVMVFVETYDRIVDAIAREQQIKKWSRRKKEALIAYDYEALPDLASRPKRK
ncbi:MAG: excinuclease subunit protein [Devosia sp.]|nr:excinuclease subunit protein [Devosia sp.]